MEHAGLAQNAATSFSIAAAASGLREKMEGGQTRIRGLLAG